MKEAGAASGVIYRWLGVNDFPQDVRDGIKLLPMPSFTMRKTNRTSTSLSLSQNTENEHTTTESSTLSDRTFVRE